VESWHKTFKKQYLGYTRDLRPDDLVFLLQGSVDIDFRTTYYKISHGLQPITLSEHAMARKKKATALPFVDAKDMITEMPQDRMVPCFPHSFILSVVGVMIFVTNSPPFFCSICSFQLILSLGLVDHILSVRARISHFSYLALATTTFDTRSLVNTCILCQGSTMM